MARGKGRGALDEDERALLGGCLCCSVFIVSCFLLGFSFRIVDESQVGLIRAELSGAVIEQDAKPTGRYWLGIGFIFEKFPKIYQHVIFDDDGVDSELVDAFEVVSHGSLRVRSSDGQFIGLGVSFQYTLDPATVYDLYVTFGTAERHNAFIVREARATFFEAASHYTAQDFFTQRVEIEADLFSAITEGLSDKMANVTALQMGRVSMTPLIDSLVRQRFLTAREIARQEEVIRLTVIQQDTEFLRMEYEAETNLQLVAMQQVNENTRLALEGTKVVIEKETEIAVAQIEADALADVTVYESETENLRLGLVGNVTVVQAMTQLLEAHIWTGTEVARALKDEEISIVSAGADAAAIRLTASADARRTELLSAALRSFFSQVVSDGFEASQINSLEWIVVATAPETRANSFDSQTPALLRLEPSAGA